MKITPGMMLSIGFGVIGFMCARGVGALIGMLVGPLVWRYVKAGKL